MSDNEGLEPDLSPSARPRGPDEHAPALAPNLSSRVKVDVRDSEVGERVDVVLGREVPELSRRKARELALRGRVRVNGRKVSPSCRVELGDIIELSPVTAASLRSEEPTILRVTPRVIYVDKPAGWHVHDLRLEGQSLAAWLAPQHPECGAASPQAREGGAVHRLDFQTSGVVAFARDRATYLSLREAFAAGLIRKRYLASCECPATQTEPSTVDASVPRLAASLASSVTSTGELAPSELPTIRLPSDALSNWSLERDPSEAEVAERHETLACLPELGAGLGRDDQGARLIVLRAPLGPRAGGRLVMVRLDGRRAQTRLSWLFGDASRALALLWLDTGERHQLRAHLAWAGMPIIGDESYGGASSTRLCLHAHHLDLSAALEGEMPVKSPIPAALTRTLLARD